MNWRETSGGMLRYWFRQGEGPCLVLIHEMGGSIESWDKVLAHLDTEHPVLVPEMRGMGLSERVRGAITLADLASDIRELLNALEIDQPVVLSGCAVGGAVALQFALDFPQRTAGVVPLDPALGTQPDKVAAILALADRMEAEGMRAVEPILLDRTYPGEYRQADPVHFARVRGRWLANDPRSFAAYFRMLANADIFSRLSDLSCPVVLGSGIDDTFRDPQYVASVASEIQSARVVSLKAAHHVPDQAPLEVSKLLKDMAALFSAGAHVKRASQDQRI
ncbi:alpha/beta fold hydrolase [Ochrobactrum sp. S46]|nr:alpha/beta fold hydrolase [Ochrobactrum sp. S45]MBK0046190.1 alpha/beta fold hydrolase [Ochrobactrum sp. S46]